MLQTGRMGKESGKVQSILFCLDFPTMARTDALPFPNTPERKGGSIYQEINPFAQFQCYVRTVSLFFPTFEATKPYISARPAGTFFFDSDLCAESSSFCFFGPSGRMMSRLTFFLSRLSCNPGVKMNLKTEEHREREPQTLFFV